MEENNKKQCYHCKAKEVKHFNFKKNPEQGLYICKPCWIKTWEERSDEINNNNQKSL